MKSNADDTQDGAAVYSPLVLKLYDWWVLGVSNRYAWQCPTDSVLLPFFRHYLSENHLDVGVGTGYYLSRSQFASKQQIALLDLNRHSLNAARAPIAHLQPALVEEDILHPRGALGDQRFDSISLFYLLHCLPGIMSEKASTLFEVLHRHLNRGGTLYGATILGDHVSHNWLGRRLMKVYNKKGIFSNRDDAVSDIESALARHFVEVDVRQHGKVALFSARLPSEAG